MEIRTDGRAGWIELTHASVHVLAKGEDHLRERLASALAAAGGDTPVDVLTDVLTAGGVRQTPDFAIVDETDRRVLVRGAARVLLTGADDESREVVAPARAPWVDEDLTEHTTTAVLSTGEPEPVPVEPVSTPESLAPAAVSPELAPVPPVGEAAVDDSEPGRAPEAPAAGRPQFVDGHLVGPRVSPAAPSRAGADGSLEELAPEDAAPSVGGTAHGPGPSTGVLPVADEAPEANEPEPPRSPARLLLPTGEVVELDRGVLLGRAPRASAGIGITDEPHLVRVASPDNEISRSHVEVYPEGAQIIVRDLGSTNGTTLAPPEGPSRRMAPGEPQPIVPGTTIRLAGQVAVVLGDDD